MKKRPPSKYDTGGKRMSQLGYKPIQVWCDRDDMQLLKDAAAKDRRPITRFVLLAAVKAARAMMES